jgi:hypothetical protein
MEVPNIVIPVNRWNSFHDLIYLGLFNDAVSISKYIDGH